MLQKPIKVLGGDTTVTRTGPGHFDVVVKGGDRKVGQVGREEAEVGTHTALKLAEEMLLAVMQQEKDEGGWLKSLTKTVRRTWGELHHPPLVIEFPSTFNWEELNDVLAAVKRVVGDDPNEDDGVLLKEALLPFLDTLLSIHERETNGNKADDSE